MTLPFRLAVAGCTGRMGLTLVRAVLKAPDMALTAGSERPGFGGQRAVDLLAREGCRDVVISDDPSEIAPEADAVLDFTTPEASLAMAAYVASRGGIHIIGTTGFTRAQQRELAGHAAGARIVQSGNFSLGVTVLEALVERATALLGPDYDIEISEMHHRHKKDAPSGTALLLGEAAARARGVALGDTKVSGRDGITGERAPGSIGFAALRGGDVVGVHDVRLAGPGEMLTLSHQGFSREIFAQGALAAARWARERAPGLYSMRDVLGIS